MDESSPNVHHRANILQDKNSERVNLPGKLHPQLCDPAPAHVAERQSNDPSSEHSPATPPVRGRSHDLSNMEHLSLGDAGQHESRDRAGALPARRRGSHARSTPNSDRRASATSNSTGGTTTGEISQARRPSTEDNGGGGGGGGKIKRKNSFNRRYKRTACFVHSLLEVQRGFEKTNVSAAQSEPSSRSDSPTRNREAETSKKDLFTHLSKKEISDMALGVRELSKHLGSARLKLNIHHILIVTKPGDHDLVDMSRKITEWLLQQRKDKAQNGPNNGSNHHTSNNTNHQHHASGREQSVDRRSSGYTIYLEDKLEKETFVKDLRSRNYPGKLKFWSQELCSRSPQLFDFVITLGGDGTVLYSSCLFQRIVPPVLSFALGSLGFLTMFDFADFERDIVNVLQEGVTAALRMRIECVVYRARRYKNDQFAFHAKELHDDIIRLDHVGEDTGAYATNLSNNHKDVSGSGKTSDGSGGESHSQSPPSRPTSSHHGNGSSASHGTRATHYPDVSFTVLNDLVVDRGPNPFMSSTELFGDDEHLTSIAADGVVISTPTGSTAYSLSAGGPLCHPEIPAILISPICPHTLSFRPLLVPDSMTLRVGVGYDSRSTAWASFDGRNRVELRQGDYVRISASRYPFPTCLRSKQTADWFESISTKLNWNERKKQKSV